MKRIIIASLLGLLSFFAFSEAGSEALLKKIDEKTMFSNTDYSAKYMIVQSKPGESKSNIEAEIYRRDAKSCFTILITGPAKDKGKGYVQFDSDIWFYDPKDDQFTFTEAKNKFQGTNATTADFTPQHFARDYDVVSTDKVKLGELSCILLTLKAKSKKTEYQQVRLWVTEKDLLIRKKEDYSLSGQLLRTMAVVGYQTVGENSVPSTLVVRDNLKGKMIKGKMQYETTQITISDVSFAKVNDNVYTKHYVQFAAKMR